MSSKTKFPTAAALAVVRELMPLLMPQCVPGGPDGKPWFKVAGSLRRKKPEVGDIEIVYISAFGEVPDGLFTRDGNLFDAALEGLITNGVLAMRRNVNGGTAWGPSNKLAVHVASGIPIDFFSTTVPDFWSYLVCRTGSHENNIRIATAAHERGLKWLPTRGGMQVLNTALAGHALNRRDLHTGQVLRVMSEQDVYAFAGLPYLEPQAR